MRGNHAKLYILIAVIIIVAGGFFAIRQKGYRLTPALKLIKAASIEIKSEQPGVKIFINNRKQQAGVSGSFEDRNITPGLHNVMVAKDGHWPWMKNVELEPGEKSLIAPFNLPVSPSGVIIPAGDAEYASLVSKIKANLLPQPKKFPIIPLYSWVAENITNFKVSADTSVAAWAEGEKVFVAWIATDRERPPYFCDNYLCSDTMLVFDSKLPLKTIEFYRDRNDVLLLAAGGNIYALEINKIGTQNFQPVYQGENPAFAKGDDYSIYIKDGAILMQVPM